MANEPYRLRSLCFEWERRAGDACDNYQPYKGRCFRCDETPEAHTRRECAAELRALLAQPAMSEAKESEGVA